MGQILCVFFVFSEWYNFLCIGLLSLDLDCRLICCIQLLDVMCFQRLGVGGTTALSSCLKSMVSATRHDQFTEDIVGLHSCWLYFLLVIILCLWKVIFHGLLVIYTVIYYELLIWT